MILFIKPNGWDSMTNIEVRVGRNVTSSTMKNNSLCDNPFVGPPVKDVDLVVAFICHNVHGRFVTVQRTLPSVTISVAHVKIETALTQG